MGSVVIGDQGSLDGFGTGPVVPDGDGQGQQPLGDAGVDARGGPAAVAFEVELAFEGVVDRLDPLADPADGPVAGRLLAAGRAGPGPRRTRGGAGPPSPPRPSPFGQHRSAPP